MIEQKHSAAAARLVTILAANRATGTGGITAVCSAHPDVLRVALQRAATAGTPVLIEATCNQVNQEGGYTGLTPVQFARRVRALAAESGLAPDLLLLGGDHLGPNPWRNLSAAEAMRRAQLMVAAYAEAGFEKLHLDASMACADDPDPLPPETIAERAATLCGVAERIATFRPLYVIGTEVPTPGGAIHATEHVAPTLPADIAHTLALHRTAFGSRGLAHAMERAVALVVQPGVEFGPETVHPYDRAAARTLVAALKGTESLVFEAHSTDYQSGAALAALVADRFAILKVGPELTFALREALLALDLIDADLSPPDRRARVRPVLEAAMDADPRWWCGHHTPEDRVGRLFSRADRVRYYWPTPTVGAAVRRLMDNLSRTAIPATLLSQHRPGYLASTPQGVVDEAVARVLARYDAATEVISAR